MRLAIHQPNFCPWEPYFEKMGEVDLFVFLTRCQWDKGGHQNRFHLLGDWNTMSVNRGLEPIAEKCYARPEEDWRRIKNRLVPYRPWLNELDHLISASLCATNIAIIKQIAQWREIQTETALDYETELRGTARLVDICRHYGADTYVSNLNGQNYLELDLFKAAGIKVEFRPQSQSTPHVLEVLNHATI